MALVRLVSIFLRFCTLAYYAWEGGAAETRAPSSGSVCHADSCTARHSPSAVDQEKARSLIQFHSKRVQLADSQAEGAVGAAPRESGGRAGAPALSEDEKAAFLIAASFGPSAASMAAMGGMSRFEWIIDQMSMEPTSHRVHYRSRVNPHAGQSNLTMLARGICDKGSRWRNFAFSRADEGRAVKVENGVITVDGEFRTNLAQPDFAENGTGTTIGTPWSGLSGGGGYVCSVEEAVGGKVLIDGGGPCEKGCPGCEALPNPALWLVDPGLSTEPALGFETGLKEGLLFLSQSAPGCSLGSFIKQNEKYYIHEPRLELLGNEVQSPSGGKYEKAFVLVSNNVTAGCNQYGRQLSVGRCQEAAEELGLPFEGEVLWEEEPLKCLTDGTKVWHNSRWTGSKDVMSGRYHLVCQRPCPAAERSFLNGAGCRIERAACGGVKDVVCGSPGEVANDPKKGHYYGYYQIDLPIKINDKRREFGPDKLSMDPGIVWTNLALTAQDQLRQRVAWALSQIFVVSINGFGRGEWQSEQWVHYYDVFVRHAFGDFRDVLKEVSYSPQMMFYLTYRLSSAFDATGYYYPDENYAREIMQLFTLGQWMLNMDGTEMKDAQGQSILVYDNDDIMNFARVFTGFRLREERGNIEHASGGINMIDPAWISPEHHDVYPKPDLADNFLGDRYPLCTDLPDQAFLRKGAVYEFLGYKYDGGDALNVTEGSALYMALEAPAVTIELASTVPCAGSLCTAESIKVLKVGDIFYEYVRPTCVTLFFYHPRITKTSTYRWNEGGVCSHAYFDKAAAACCDADGKYIDEGYDTKEQVTFPEATARCARLGLEACVDDGPSAAGETFRVWTARECPVAVSVDDAGKVASLAGPKEAHNPFGGAWRAGEFPRPEACPSECQGIRIPATSGNVTEPLTVVLNYVECPKGADSGSVEWQLKCDADAQVQFQVDALSRSLWLEVAGERRFWSIGLGKYWAWSEPSQSYTVPAGNHTVKITPKSDKGFLLRALQLVQGTEACRLLEPHHVKGDVCVCPMKVEERPVFDAVPSSQDLLDRLWIGAFPPDAFGQAPTGTWKTSGDVAAYMPSGSVDTSTTFAYQGRYYKNIESVVQVGDSYAMRNAPVFMNSVDPRERDAHDEVDAFLDHLVAHSNVAPFIAYRLIQRFTTSNPTGSYVKAVAEAFVSGSYDGKEYPGNLGATIAAILLYPGSAEEEAAASLLDEGLRGGGRSADVGAFPSAPAKELDLRQLAVGAETRAECSNSIFNLPVASRSHSSVFKNKADNRKSMLHSLSSWVAGSTIVGKEWLQMDLEVAAEVAGVAMQGRYNSTAEWVTSLTLSTSRDAAVWTLVPGEFAANTDADTVVKVLLATPLLAKSVRIYPQTWQGARPAMRAGLVMCSQQACIDGDVRLRVAEGLKGRPEGSRGTPEIFLQGAFHPLCWRRGRHFWGEAETTQFCRAMGAEGGRWSSTGWIYDKDAVEVRGWLEIYEEGLTEDCQAGYEVGMEIECMCTIYGCPSEVGFSTCLTPPAPAPTPASDSLLLLKVETAGCRFTGCGAANFYLNGENLQGPSERGLNVVTLSSTGKVLETGVFDANAWGDVCGFAQFLQNVEHGTLLLLAVKASGELLRKDPSEGVKLLVEEALASLGATQFASIGRDMPYALVAKKGFPGLTQEVVGVEKDRRVRTLEAAFEREAGPSPPEQPAAPKACENWDVRISGALGTSGTPEVFLSGQFRPLCSKRFTEESALAFCMSLGASGGATIKNKLVYETDAVELRSWEEMFQEGTTADCAAGQPVGMWIQCSADLPLHSSCSSNGLQGCWYEAVPSSECPCGHGLSAGCDLAECSRGDSVGALCEADQELPDGKPDWEADNCPDGYDVFRLACSEAGPEPRGAEEPGRVGGLTLEVRSAGFHRGNSGLSEFYMQGVNLQMPAKDGINVVVLDGATHALRMKSFDLGTSDEAVFLQQAEELSAYLEAISDGSIVMLSVKRSADLKGYERGMVTAALTSLGASTTGLLPDQPYALIVKKGFPEDGVHEKIGSAVDYRVIRVTAFFPFETAVTPAPTHNMQPTEGANDGAVTAGDPRFGKLREPVLKILHYMRAMEYEEVEPREDVAMVNLRNVLGQYPYSSETVFNFYKPEYSPMSFVEGDVAPEFEIFDTNRALLFFNGMMELVGNGLKECDGGFGIGGCPRHKKGYMKWSTGGSVEEAIGQLSTLLTAGRASGDFLRRVYDGAEEGGKMQAVQEAILFTPEFNTQGESLPAGQRPVEEEGSGTAGDREPYKAIVKVYFGGGMDSFNMLVPMDCYLLDEYCVTRQNVALDPAHLHKIDVESSNQSCKTFGLHPALPDLKTLYEKGDLAFVSNIGGLVEPLTKETFKSSTQKCVGLFSHSNQELGAQTMKCQEKTARDKGAGGRLADVLSRTYRTHSYSLVGNAAWSQGFSTHIDIIDAKRGLVRLHDYEHLKNVVANVTGEKHDSMYSEEYVKIVKKGVETGEKVGGLLEEATLEGSWTEGAELNSQLRMVAKVIKTREERQAERDIFWVRLGGFDHHHELTLSLLNKFVEINAAVSQFVEELKLMGVFDQVVLTTSSEFGRTLTSNGAGTDHGWAANHFVVGGAVAGGKIYNRFPEHLVEGNEQDLGRGRMMPLYPWESMELPVAQWMGLEDADVSFVFPNAANFNASQHFIQRSELFPTQ